MRKFVFILFSLFVAAQTLNAQDLVTNRHTANNGEIENVNHPEVLYWFFTPELVESGRYMQDLDFIAQNTPFDLIFITAREKLNLYDREKMKPVLEKVVKRAHELNLKVALQFWDDGADMPLENMASTIVDTTITLDDKGRGEYLGRAQHIRYDNTPRSEAIVSVKSQLYRVYSFDLLEKGCYKEGSLEDITQKCKTEELGVDKVKVTIDRGESYAGKSVHIMTQHTYNWNDVFGGYAADQYTSILEDYSDIPFDGVGLDEYKHLQSEHPSTIASQGGEWNVRFYSSAMSDMYQNRYKRDMATDLLAMRYVAKGDDKVRIRAINSYMDLMRSGPLMVEESFYSDGKRLFGKDCFIGLHNTYHTLTSDEIWQTGANWWTIPRDYGHTDEHSPFPTQMGVMVCNPKNVIYNMYYNKDAKLIYSKAASDLAFGIRTHYHAMNDNHGWGVRLESPEFLGNISPVEDAARLLNHFNPAPPMIKTLIVFGMEAMQNNYPDIEHSSFQKLNSIVNPEGVAMDLWRKGYRNALVSSDVIEKGMVEVKKDGTLSINGNEFNQLVYLYPNYAKKSVLDLLKKYSKRGKKAIVVGDFVQNFEGEYQEVDNKVFGQCCDLSHIVKYLDPEAKIGEFASINRDGSYVELFPEELIVKESVEFNFELDGKSYSGVCQGMIALKASNSVDKIAAKGLTILKCDNNTILEFKTPTDLFYNNGELTTW